MFPAILTLLLLTDTSFLILTIYCICAYFYCCLQACKNPLGSVEYLSSPSFASDLVALCHSVRAQFEQETRCLFMQSPVYVFGDIHGELLMYIISHTISYNSTVFSSSMVALQLSLLHIIAECLLHCLVLVY
jgi:hypothetical protein